MFPLFLRNNIDLNQLKMKREGILGETKRDWGRRVIFCNENYGLKSELSLEISKSRCYFLFFLGKRLSISTFDKGIKVS